MKKTAGFLLSVVLSAFICLSGCGSVSNPQSGSSSVSYHDITKVGDHLYSISYDAYNPTVAGAYLENLLGNAEAFSCSACRNGNFVGRNYDWTYDDNIEFVIQVSQTEGRHASIGVAGCHSLLDLSAENVASGKDLPDYAYLPFFTLDGINDAGVYVSDNMVADGTMGQTSGTNPEGERLCAMAIPRFVLDNADSAEHAIALLKEKNIYMPSTEDYTEEIHFMIADPSRTYVVEFINNELTVLEGDNILTNFYLTGFDKSEQTLSDFPAGLERYNILRDNYALGSTEEGMLELMQSVRYSRYCDPTTVPFWYTEFCGDYRADGLDLVLTAKDIGEPDLSQSLDGAGKFRDIIAAEIEGYQNKTRNGEYWISTHTSVYDLAQKTLSIIAQENGQVLKFDLDGNQIF